MRCHNTSLLFRRTVANCGSFFPLWHTRIFFYFIYGTSELYPFISSIRGRFDTFYVVIAVTVTEPTITGSNTICQSGLQHYEFKRISSFEDLVRDVSSVSWTYLIAFSQTTTFFRVMNNSGSHRRRLKMDHIIFENCLGLVHTIVFSRTVPCL